MKKPLLILTVFTAAVAAQASTCETRVDSHPCATTPQRVDYCLTPETAVAEKDGPSVIVSSVTTKEPDTSTPETTSSLKQKYYNEEDMSVRHKYVGSTQFPQLKNDIPSERERQADQNVAAKKAATQEQPTRVMHSQQTEQVVSQSVRYEQKPTRTMKEEKTVTVVQTTPQTTVVQETTVTTETTPVTVTSAPAEKASSGGDFFEEADQLYQGTKSR